MNNYKEDSIVFLYKGGTTMQIIYKKYQKLYDNNNFFKEVIKNFFARSDSDYQIFIDKVIYSNDNDYNKIFYDINKLVYNILFQIKKYFNEYNYIINFNLVNDDILKQKLNKINSILSDNKKKLDFFDPVNTFIGITYGNTSYFSEEIPENFKYYALKDSTENYDDENNDEDDKISINPIPPFFNHNKNDKISINPVPPFLNHNKKKEISKKEEFIKYRKISSIRKDFYITGIDIKGNNKYNPKLISLNNKNEDNGIFMYLNETNIFKTNNGTTNFNLFRSKINTVAYFKTKNNEYGFINFPSELIDISISKYNDEKIKTTNLNTDIKKYKHIYNNNELHFNSYTIIGFINDIAKALFYENEYPWGDVKYLKKINRIISLMLIYLNNKYSNMNDFIKLFKKLLNDNSTDIYNFSFTCINKDSNVNITAEKDIFKIIELTQGVIDNINTTPDDVKQKIKDMIQTINNLLDKFIITQVQSGYNDNPENVPYLEKYLKYKNKYLQLKNKL